MSKNYEIVMISSVSCVKDLCNDNDIATNLRKTLLTSLECFMKEMSAAVG